MRRGWHRRTQGPSTSLGMTGGGEVGLVDAGLAALICGSFPDSTRISFFSATAVCHRLSSEVFGHDEERKVPRLRSG